MPLYCWGEHVFVVCSDSKSFINRTTGTFQLSDCYANFALGAVCKYKYQNQTVIRAKIKLTSLSWVIWSSIIYGRNVVLPLTTNFLTINLSTNFSISRLNFTTNLRKNQVFVFCPFYISQLKGQNIKCHLCHKQYK